MGKGPNFTISRELYFAWMSSKKVEQLKELSLCYDCEIVETTRRIIVKFYFIWPNDPRESFSKDITKLWKQK
jgi:hypothetical protein